MVRGLVQCVFQHAVGTEPQANRLAGRRRGLALQWFRLCKALGWGFAVFVLAVVGLWGSNVLRLLDSCSGSFEGYRSSLGICTPSSRMPVQDKRWGAPATTDKKGCMKACRNHSRDVCQGLHEMPQELPEVPWTRCSQLADRCTPWARPRLPHRRAAITTSSLCQCRLILKQKDTQPCSPPELRQLSETNRSLHFARLRESLLQPCPPQVYCTHVHGA